MAQKALMPPAQFEYQLQFQKKLHEQRRTREAGRKERLAELSAKEDGEHQRILRHAHARYPELCGEPLQVVVIASGRAQLLPAPVERKEKYTEHLLNIIEQAAERADLDEIISEQHQAAREKLATVDERFRRNPELHAMSDRLCTLCKGGCCNSGQEHAYLSTVTIRRYMDDHPDLSKAEMLDLYLSHLNKETISDSCINQTATGCALPRELRSDICNAFYCDPVKSYQNKALDSTETEPVLAIQRAGIYQGWPDPDMFNDVVTVALLDECHTHELCFPD